MFVTANGHIAKSIVTGGVGSCDFIFTALFNRFQHGEMLHAVRAVGNEEESGLIIFSDGHRLILARLLQCNCSFGLIDENLPVISLNQ